MNRNSAVYVCYTTLNRLRSSGRFSYLLCRKYFPAQIYERNLQLKTEINGQVMEVDIEFTGTGTSAIRTIKFRLSYRVAQQSWYNW